MDDTLRFVYDGQVFETTHDARWAVFLNALGWVWEYRPKSFILKNEGYFSPTFYLPQIKTWIVVYYMRDIDETALKAFSRELKDSESVIATNEEPSPKSYTCFAEGEECCPATITSYIRSKDWGCPYFGDYWDDRDKAAFAKAAKARFVFIEIE